MGFFPTTLNDLRTSTSLNITDEYYVTDPGLEGFWKFEGISGNMSMDNMGTIVFNVSNFIVKRIFDGHVNVKWFGALGDGVTDDTLAVQNAINSISASENGNGTLYFPTGYYLIRQITIPFNIVNEFNFGKITILGDGMFYSVFMGIPEYPLSDHCDFPTPILPQITPKVMFKVQSSFVTFKNIGIQGFVYNPYDCYSDFLLGSGQIPYTSNFYEFTGILLENGIYKDSNRFILDNCLIRACEIGLKVEGSYAVSVNQCLFGSSGNELIYTCNYGLLITEKVTLEQTFYPNMITITDTTFYNCKKWGTAFKGGTELILRGVVFDTNGTYSTETGGNTETGALLVYGLLNTEQDVCIINVSESSFINNSGYSFKCVENQNVIFNFFGCDFTMTPNQVIVLNDRCFGVLIDLLPNEGDHDKIVNLVSCSNNIDSNTIGTGESFILKCSDINVVGSKIDNSFYSPPLNVLGLNQTNIVGAY